MSFSQVVRLHFHPVICCACSGTFAIDAALNKRARVDKKVPVYCAACGTKQGWGGQTPIDRARTEVNSELVRLKQKNEHLEAVAESRRERAETAERSLSATKGVVTKIKNKISKGICPCCNRSFTNLRRHMNSKHPDYALVEA